MNKINHAQPVSLKLVVLYKLVLGLVEVVLGTAFVILALGVQSVTAGGFIQKLIAKELGEDPNDVFIHWILTHNLPFPIRTALHLSLLMIILGLIKLAIAYSIWQHSHRAAVFSIILVTALGLGGLIDTVYFFSWFKLVATTMDFILLYYLVIVVPKNIPP